MELLSRFFVSLEGMASALFVKLATVVTPQEEELIWSTGTIGVRSPLSLQRAVFYYVGKVFCLRGGEEQRSLKISQFKREKDSYVYVENGSKNCSGTSTRITNKVVPVYARPESRPRCLVYLLDTYLEKLPVWAKEKDIFYCRPAKIPNHSGVWYECAAVGKEKLRTFLASV